MPSTVVQSHFEPGASVLPQRRFTQEEYFAMADVGVFGEDDSIELIDGRVVEMGRENSPDRVSIMKVNRAFVTALNEERYAVQIQFTLSLEEWNAPEPDLTVLWGPPDDVLEKEPEVVLVREMTDTSLERDRSVNSSLYAEQEIPEYWIVNLRNRTPEVYWEPGEGEYRQRRTRSEDETATRQFEDAPSFAVEALLPAET